jgi:hypothetical protein
MQPNKCTACGGTDFDHDRFHTGLAAFPRTFFNVFFGSVLAKCSVCLTCGFVAVHVDDASLATVRARKVRGDVVDFPQVKS